MFKNILLTKIKQRNIFIPVLIIIIACSSLIIINYITLKILSGNRAYISGASFYASAQKDASRHLVTYLYNKDVEQWKLFNNEMLVPLGDKAARETLLRNGDLQTIKAGFIAGRNDQQDIDNLVWLFRNFQSFSFFKEAIKEWENADNLILKMSGLGNEIHQRIIKGELSEIEKNLFLQKLSDTSAQLDLTEKKFAQSLIVVNRFVKNTLFIINIFIILIIIGSISIYYLLLLNRFKSSKLKTDEVNASLIIANRELDKFVYSASHDLRSPISSLKGLINIIKDEDDLPQIKSYLDLMTEILEKQDQFIKDIIDYSRNKKAQISIETVSIESIVDEAIFQNKFLQESKRIAVFKSIDINFIVSDALKLKIIINNLYTNCIKYYDETKIKPSIAINAYDEKHEHIIVIEDNGIGIKKEFLAKIFDMFFVTNNNNKGSGLGLYLVKEAVDYLKGTIKVKSEINVGTQFIITLPKKYEAKQ